MDGAGEKRLRVSWIRRLLPKRRPYQVLLVAGLVVLSTGVVLCLPEREPSYEGKPASYWLDWWWQGVDGPKTADAAFKAMGPKAVPFLVKVLDHKPTALSVKLDEARGKYDTSHPGGLPPTLEKVLPSEYRIQNRRETAAFLLGQIGPPAAAAIPVLKRVSSDPNENDRVRREAWAALCAMGEKLASLVPEFMLALKSDDIDTREDGLILLQSTGPPAKPAVPVILKLLQDGKLQPPRAAWALWTIDRQTNIALRIFTEGLQVTNYGAKIFCVHSLHRMGPAAVLAAPHLVPLLQDPEPGVRHEVELTLREIAPELLAANNQKLNQETDATVEKLVETIETGDFAQCMRAVEGLAVLGPAAKAAVPVLIRNLNGFPTHVAGRLGMVPTMNSQRYIGEALAEIGPDAKAAVPALIEAGGNPHGAVNVWFKVLGQIGPAAKDAVPLLEKNLSANDERLRLAAADALTRIVPDQCSNAVAVLCALQRDNSVSGFYRLSAAVPLWKLGLESQSPVPALLKELEQSPHSDASSYMDLLGEVGPDAKAALPKLETYLDPPKDIRLRRKAAIAIRKIDPAEAARLGLPGVLAVR